MKPVGFRDFSGGITDKDIPGYTNRYQTCDNLLIEPDKSLLQRDGFDIFSSTAYQMDASTRVARLANFDFDSEIIGFQGKKALYVNTSSAWAHLQGPGGGDSAQYAFSSNNADALVEEAQWQKHLFAASIPGSAVVTMNLTTDFVTAPANTIPAYDLATSLPHVISIPVKFYTTGSLPTGITAGATYYVVQLTVASPSDTFKISSTVGGSAIDLSGSQSGVHTIVVQASDPPVKIYRDESNTLRLRTAGLPEFTRVTPSNTGGLVLSGGASDGGLVNAISLANDLRTQMISHYGSNGATAGTVETLSTRSHTSDAGGALAAQATAVTNSTAATNLSSLITLLNTLRTQYQLHIADAQIQQPGRSSRTLRQYHVAPASVGDFYRLHDCPNNDAIQPEYFWIHFLNLSVEDASFTIPSSAVIADILPYLNDLREKWNWHQYATLTHYNAWRYRGTESYTQLGVHATAVARVEPYSWAQITPPVGAFIQYVKDIKTEFDYHRTGGMHHQSDTVTAIPSGYPTTPTTLYEAITLLGAIAHNIYLHKHDSDGANNAGGGTTAQYIGTSTSGSAVIASATSPANNTLRDYWAVPVIGTGTTPFLWNVNYSAMTKLTSYRVTANVLNTSITVANVLNASLTDNQFLFTQSQYHIGFTGADSPVTSPFTKTFSAQDEMAAIDYRFQSAAQLQLVADFAHHVAQDLKSHTLDGTSVLISAEQDEYAKTTYFGRTYTRYAPKARDTATGLINVALGSAVTMHLPLSNNELDGGLGGLGIGAFFWPVSAANGSNFSESRFETANTPDAVSINYKAVFKYDYKVGDKQFTDRSAPSEAINVIGFLNQADSEISEKGRFSTSFADIFVYVNGTNENWDTADTINFRKEIYRTLGDGDIYFKCNYDVQPGDTTFNGDITNATTTFSDYTLDENLPNQLALYTNGGAPENNRPPLATNIHVFGNVMYYVVGNKVYQSVPNDPDSVPSDQFEEFEENVVGVSSTRSVAVAFGASRVYRLVGGFDTLGRGALTYERIFDRTGCISAQSIVKADNGIFFAGKDGFYFTDGYQCMRVTDLETTFRGYADSEAKRNRIQGVYDNISKRIYWTVQTAAGSNPDKIWVLDLKFGIKPDATPITRITKTTGFNPTALGFFNGILHYGDGDGYVFKQTAGRNIDLVKDTGTAATSWAAETVRWDYKTCNMDFGSAALRKFFQRITSQFEQQDTNLSVQITSDADKGRGTSTLPVIRSRKLTSAAGWGDSKIDWMASVYTQEAGDVIDEFRWMKGDGYMRSNYRAFEFATAYCVILNSTDLGTITVANVSGNVYSATLTSLIATRKWPLYSVGYYLKIASVEYPVTVRTSDSVVRFDSTGLTTPGTGVVSSFELWGYPKGERARFMGFEVNVDAADDEQDKSKGPVTTGGQNA